MEPERARELIARERARIERAITDLAPAGADELSNIDQHPADAGSELYTEERDAGLVQRLREELAAVERAEARLRDGTYGVSVESGTPIPDQRLEAMPLAERTVEEQARLERGR
jgi:DnaK suppressor protein